MEASYSEFNTKNSNVLQPWPKVIPVPGKTKKRMAHVRRLPKAKWYKESYSYKKYKYEVPIQHKKLRM